MCGILQFLGFWHSISIPHYVSELFNYSFNKLWSESKWHSYMENIIMKVFKQTLNKNMWKMDISLWIPIAPCITFSFSLNNRWPDVWNYKSCLWLFIPTSSIMAVRHESTIFWATAQPQVVKTTLILPWKWIGLVQYWDPPSSQLVIRLNPKLYWLQRQYWKGCYPLGLNPGLKQTFDKS